MMTDKHVRDLSPEESAELLRQLKRGLPPTELPPLDTSVLAKKMSDAERREWLAAHRKRFPS
jgi:hypothetical protein